MNDDVKASFENDYDERGDAVSSVLDITNSTSSSRNNNNDNGDLTESTIATNNQNDPSSFVATNQVNEACETTMTTSTITPTITPEDTDTDTEDEANFTLPSSSVQSIANLDNSTSSSFRPVAAAATVTATSQSASSLSRHAATTATAARATHSAMPTIFQQTAATTRPTQTVTSAAKPSAAATKTTATTANSDAATTTATSAATTDTTDRPIDATATFSASVSATAAAAAATTRAASASSSSMTAATRRSAAPAPAASAQHPHAPLIRHLVLQQRNDSPVTTTTTLFTVTHACMIPSLKQNPLVTDVTLDVASLLSVQDRRHKTLDGLQPILHYLERLPYNSCNQSVRKITITCSGGSPGYLKHYINQVDAIILAILDRNNDDTTSRNQEDITGSNNSILNGICKLWRGKSDKTDSDTSTKCTSTIRELVLDGTVKASPIVLQQLLSSDSTGSGDPQSLDTLSLNLEYFMPGVFTTEHEYHGLLDAFGSINTTISTLHLTCRHIRPLAPVMQRINTNFVALSTLSLHLVHWHDTPTSAYDALLIALAENTSVHRLKLTGQRLSLLDGVIVQLNHHPVLMYFDLVIVEAANPQQLAQVAAASTKLTSITTPLEAAPAHVAARTNTAWPTLLSSLRKRKHEHDKPLCANFSVSDRYWDNTTDKVQVSIVSSYNCPTNDKIDGLVDDSDNNDNESNIAPEHQQQHHARQVVRINRPGRNTAQSLIPYLFSNVSTDDNVEQDDEADDAVPAIEPLFALAGLAPAVILAAHANVNPHPRPRPRRRPRPLPFLRDRHSIQEAEFCCVNGSTGIGYKLTAIHIVRLDADMARLLRNSSRPASYLQSLTVSNNAELVEPPARPFNRVPVVQVQRGGGGGANNGGNGRLAAAGAVPIPPRPMRAAMEHWHFFDDPLLQLAHPRAARAAAAAVAAPVIPPAPVVVAAPPRPAPPLAATVTTPPINTTLLTTFVRRNESIVDLKLVGFTARNAATRTLHRRLQALVERNRQLPQLLCLQRRKRVQQSVAVIDSTTTPRNDGSEATPHLVEEPPQLDVSGSGSQHAGVNLFSPLLQLTQQTPRVKYADVFAALAVASEQVGEHD